MNKNLKRFFSSSGDQIKFFRGSLASLLIKIGQIGFGFITTLLLARFLGPVEFGKYSYIIALIFIFTIPAQFGLPSLVVRETAKSAHQGNWDEVRSLWRWSAIAVLILSIIISIIFISLLWLSADYIPAFSTDTLLWALLLIPLLALGNLRGAALRGLNKLIQGQLPENIFRPISLITLILLYWWFYEGQMNANVAICIYVIAALIAFIVGAYLLYVGRPPEMKSSNFQPIYRTRSWFVNAAALGLVSSAQIVNGQIDILILGLFRPAEEIGFYRVAVQGAALAGAGVSSIAMFVGPQITRLFLADDMIKLQKILVWAARMMFFSALPVGILFALFGDVLLAKIFGTSYQVAHAPLMVLSISPIINGALGASALVLNMTGRESVVVKAVGVATIINIVANFLLIPILGMLGAALSTILSFFIWKITLVIYIRSQLGLNPTIINN